MPAEPPLVTPVVTTDDLTKPTDGAVIGARKVIGASVFDLNFERIGTIEDVMIDKATGRVDFVALAFGGWILGIGDKHCGLPWGVLRWDTRLTGFVADLDRQKLLETPPQSPASAEAGPEGGSAGVAPAPG